MLNPGEEYWILQSRKESNKFYQDVFIVKIFTLKHLLPWNRVKDTVIFQVIGIDFVGLPYVKVGTKA